MSTNSDMEAVEPTSVTRSRDSRGHNDLALRCYYAKHACSPGEATGDAEGFEVLLAALDDAEGFELFLATMGDAEGFEAPAEGFDTFLAFLAELPLANFDTP